MGKADICHRGLTEAIVGMRKEEALALVQSMLDSGADPRAVLDQAKDAMTELGRPLRVRGGVHPRAHHGRRDHEGNLRRAQNRTSRVLARAEKRGAVVIATVQGDIHDIGKDIVVMMLDVNGYEVHDLGVDVPVETVVEAIREHKPGGRRPLRPAHTVLRLDEGDGRCHHGRRAARPGQDHGRRRAGGPAGAGTTPVPTAGAATSPSPSSWRRSGREGRRDGRDRRGAVQAA